MSGPVFADIFAQFRKSGTYAVSSKEVLGCSATNALVARPNRTTAYIILTTMPIDGIVMDQITQT